MNSLSENVLNPVDILRDSWQFFRSSFGELLALFIPLLFIASILQILLLGVVTDDQKMRVVWLSGLIFKPFYTALMVLYVQKKTVQEVIGNQALIFSAIKLWLPICAVTMVVGLLTVFGLYAYIIPGIWIAARLSLAEYFLIVEHNGLVEAVQKSFMATAGYFWQVIVVLFVAIIPVLVAGILVKTLFKSENANIPASIFSQMLVSFIGLFSIVAIYRVYMKLSANLAKPELP
ncbi:MAG: hypothetical protein V3W04_06085 [Gammaproteobacteria bacterium]